MVKGLYQYLREAWKKPNPEMLRQRLIDWRKSQAIVRVERPLRLDRARALGYKAKNGVTVVRIRILRGGRSKSMPKKGRKGRRRTTRKFIWMNYREIAEQRVARKFRNMEVVNSYEVGRDGMHYFYEVILADRSSPEILADKELSKLVLSPKGKSFRGLTSAGVKARGLRSPKTDVFEAPKGLRVKHTHRFKDMHVDKH